MHKFSESLKMSHSASDLPFWEPVYRQAFPTFSAMIDHRQDGWHQRQGIDRSIVLECSKQIKVDEKVRFKNSKTGKVYEDIALEFISNDRTGAPGWVCKPLMADYIAYAIAPIGKCLLLPVVQLQTAWETNKEKWLGNHSYKKVDAINDGYTTKSVAVPVDVVFMAIGKCLRIEFDPVESEGGHQ